MAYGQPPVDLGFVDLEPKEMMFWLYCPIKEPFYSSHFLPSNLTQYEPIVNKAKYDCGSGRWDNSFVYITAKTLYVTHENIGNRPGWHSDGFGTSDLNYIWYDRAPTEFLLGEFDLPEDCDESMVEMQAQSDNNVNQRMTYPDKHLLKLDQSVIHRCPVRFEAGMRTFVKISVSGYPYDLEGNSVNPFLGEIFDKKPRKDSRNHPSSLIK